MAKIRLTKNELKKQKDDLKRFTRYLPTLELKKKQLLQEIITIQQEADKLNSEISQAETSISKWVGVLAEDVDLKEMVQVKELRLDQGNIAGIDIPIFEDLEFETVTYDFFETPFWVDTAVGLCQDQIKRYAALQVNEQQMVIVHEELRTTIQRIKLFEEVKIPEARENIRVIQIFLGDQSTAEVVRGKIAKAKIEKKKAGLV